MPDFDDRLHWYSPAANADCLLAESEYGQLKFTPQWDRLWREVEAQEAEVVAIDTAGAVFGGNERNKAISTQFMRALQAKAIQGERAIVLAAHPPAGNVSKGFAGDMAWLASARAGLSLERPQGYDALTDTPRYERVLRGLGANYSGGRSIDKLRYDHGIFVADELDEPPARTDSVAARDIMDREMLYGLIRTRNNGGKCSADWAHASSMQRRYRATFDRRTSLNDLNASFERLLASRQIVRVRVGHECLVRPADGAKYEEEQAWVI